MQHQKKFNNFVAGILKRCYKLYSKVKHYFERGTLHMSLAKLSEKKKIANLLTKHKGLTYKSGDIIGFVSKNFYLGTREYEVFLYLVGLASECNGVAFPSQDTVADHFGIDRTRVNAIVRQLKKKGVLFVEKIQQGKNPQNFYIIPTLGHFEAMVEGIFSEIDEISNGIVEKVKQTKQPQKEKKEQPKTETKNSEKPMQKTYNKKPVRTEMLPDWFEEVNPRSVQQEAKKPKTPEEVAAMKRDIQEKLAILNGTKLPVESTGEKTSIINYL
jgi:biotin operon repressor